MFEGLVVQLLEKILGSYVQSFNREHVKLGIWGGYVTLHNLALRQDALDELHLPIAVQRGMIGEIKLEVPWNKLLSSPAKLTLSNLFAVVRKRSEFPYDEEKERKSVHDRLEALERKNEQKKNEAVDEEVDKDTYTKRLMEKVIQNLQIEISNVHLRFESEDLHTPYAIGVSVASMKMRSCDSSWVEKFLDAVSNVFWKTLKIEDFSIYIDVPSEPFAEREQKLKINWEELFESGLSENRCFLVDAFSPSARLTVRRWQYYLQKQEDGEMDEKTADLLLSTPRFHLDVDTGSLRMNMDNLQYHSLSVFLDYIVNFPRYQRFLKYRPRLDSSLSAKELWSFALNSVLSEIQRRECTWDKIKRRRDLRLRYIEYFQRFSLLNMENDSTSEYILAEKGKEFLEQGEGDVEIVDAVLHSVEATGEFTLFELLRFRNSATANLLPLRKKKPHSGISEEKKAEGGWIWGWWSSGSKKEDNVENSQTETEDETLNAIEREIMEALEAVKLTEAEENEVQSLEKEVPPFHLDFNVDEVSLLLTASPNTPMKQFSHTTTLKPPGDDVKEKKSLASLRLESVRSGLVRKPNSYKANFTLDKLEVRDEFYGENSLYSVLVGSERSSSSNGNAEDPKLLTVTIESQMATENTNAYLSSKIVLERLNLVYSPILFARIKTMFSLSDASAELKHSARRRLKKLQGMSRTSIRAILDNRIDTRIQLKMKAPTISIPASTLDETSPVLKADFGYLSVGTTVHASDDDPYDCFAAALEGMSVSMKSMGSSGKQEDRLLLEPFNARLTVMKCIFPPERRPAELPKLRLVSSLKVLRINLSAQVVRNSLKILNAVAFTGIDSIDDINPIDVTFRNVALLKSNPVVTVVTHREVHIFEEATPGRLIHSLSMESVFAALIPESPTYVRLSVGPGEDRTEKFLLLKMDDEDVAQEFVRILRTESLSLSVLSSREADTEQEAASESDIQDVGDSDVRHMDIQLDIEGIAVALNGRSPYGNEERGILDLDIGKVNLAYLLKDDEMLLNLSLKSFESANMLNKCELISLLEPTRTDNDPAVNLRYRIAKSGSINVDCDVVGVRVLLTETVLADIYIFLKDMVVASDDYYFERIEMVRPKISSGDVDRTAHSHRHVWTASSDTEMEEMSTRGRGSENQGIQEAFNLKIEVKTLLVDLCRLRLGDVMSTLNPIHKLATISVKSTVFGVTSSEQGRKVSGSVENVELLDQRSPTEPRLFLGLARTQKSSLATFAYVSNANASLYHEHVHCEQSYDGLVEVTVSPVKITYEQDFISEMIDFFMFTHRPLLLVPRKQAIGYYLEEDTRSSKIGLHIHVDKPILVVPADPHRPAFGMLQFQLSGFTLRNSFSYRKFEDTIRLHQQLRFNLADTEVRSAEYPPKKGQVDGSGDIPVMERLLTNSMQFAFEIGFHHAQPVRLCGSCKAEELKESEVKSAMRFEISYVQMVLQSSQYYLILDSIFYNFMSRALIEEKEVAMSLEKRTYPSTRYNPVITKEQATEGETEDNRELTSVVSFHMYDISVSLRKSGEKIFDYFTEEGCFAGFSVGKAGLTLRYFTHDSAQYDISLGNLFVFDLRNDVRRKILGLHPTAKSSLFELNYRRVGARRAILDAETKSIAPSHFIVAKLNHIHVSYVQSFIDDLILYFVSTSRESSGAVSTLDEVEEREKNANVRDADDISRRSLISWNIEIESPSLTIPTDPTLMVDDLSPEEAERYNVQRPSTFECNMGFFRMSNSFVFKRIAGSNSRNFFLIEMMSLEMKNTNIGSISANSDAGAAKRITSMMEKVDAEVRVGVLKSAFMMEDVGEEEVGDEPQSSSQSTEAIHSILSINVSLSNIRVFLSEFQYGMILDAIERNLFARGGRWEDYSSKTDVPTRAQLMYNNIVAAQTYTEKILKTSFLFQTGDMGLVLNAKDAPFAEIDVDGCVITVDQLNDGMVVSCFFIGQAKLVDIRDRGPSVVAQEFRMLIAPPTNEDLHAERLVPWYSDTLIRNSSTLPSNIQVAVQVISSRKSVNIEVAIMCPMLMITPPIVTDIYDFIASAFQREQRKLSGKLALNSTPFSPYITQETVPEKGDPVQPEEIALVVRGIESKQGDLLIRKSSWKIEKNEVLSPTRRMFVVPKGTTKRVVVRGNGKTLKLNPIAKSGLPLIIVSSGVCLVFKNVRILLPNDTDIMELMSFSEMNMGSYAGMQLSRSIQRSITKTPPLPERHSGKVVKSMVTGQEKNEGKAASKGGLPLLSQSMRVRGEKHGGDRAIARTGSTAVRRPQSSQMRRPITDPPGREDIVLKETTYLKNDLVLSENGRIFIWKDEDEPTKSIVINGVSHQLFLSNPGKVFIVAPDVKFELAKVKIILLSGNRPFKELVHFCSSSEWKKILGRHMKLAAERETEEGFNGNSTKMELYGGEEGNEEESVSTVVESDGSVESQKLKRTKTPSRVTRKKRMFKFSFHLLFSDAAATIPMVPSDASSPRSVVRGSLNANFVKNDMEMNFSVKFENFHVYMEFPKVDFLKGVVGGGKTDIVEPLSVEVIFNRSRERTTYEKENETLRCGRLMIRSMNVNKLLIMTEPFYSRLSHTHLLVGLHTYSNFVAWITKAYGESSAVSPRKLTEETSGLVPKLTGDEKKTGSPGSPTSANLDRMMGEDGGIEEEGMDSITIVEKESISTISLKTKTVTMLIIDDSGVQNAPLLEFRLSSLFCDMDFRNSELSGVEARINGSADYFNTRKSYWEPLLEPIVVRTKVNVKPYKPIGASVSSVEGGKGKAKQKEKKKGGQRVAAMIASRPRRTIIKVASEAIVNINVTYACLSSVFRAIESWTSDVKKIMEVYSEGSQLVDDSEGGSSEDIEGGEKVSHIVTNTLEDSITIFLPFESKEFVLFSRDSLELTTKSLTFSKRDSSGKILPATIDMKIGEFDRLEGVDIDHDGMSGYIATKDRKKSSHIFTTIMLDEYHRKIVLLHTNVVVRNITSMMYEVECRELSGKFSKTTIFPPIEPFESRSVLIGDAMKTADLSLRVRPLCRGFKHKEKGDPEEEIPLEVVLYDISDGEVRIKGPREDSVQNLVSLSSDERCIPFNTSVFISDQAMFGKSSVRSITFAAPIVIRNTLPVKIAFVLEEIDTSDHRLKVFATGAKKLLRSGKGSISAATSGHLLGGQEKRIHEVGQIGMKFRVSFEVVEGFWKGARSSPRNLQEEVGEPLLIQLIMAKDSKRSVLSLSVELEEPREHHGTRVFVLFSHYWFINTTRLPLSIGVRNVSLPSVVLPQIKLGPAFHRGESDTDVEKTLTSSTNIGVFSSWGDTTPKIAIGYAKENTDWSDAFSVDTVGTSGVASFRHDDGRCEIGITITSGEGIFHRTKMIQIEPHIVLVNKCTEEVCVRQHGNPRSARKLKSGESEPFHWSKDVEVKNCAINMQIRSEENWDWSRGIPLSDELSLPLKFRGGTRGVDDCFLMQLDVVAKDAIVFVVFSNLLIQPYRVSNRSGYPVSVRQKFRDSTVIDVADGKEVAYTWDSFVNDQVLTVTVDERVVFDTPLDNIDTFPDVVVSSQPGEYSTDDSVGGILRVRVIGDGPVRVLVLERADVLSGIYNQLEETQEEKAAEIERQIAEDSQLDIRLDMPLVGISVTDGHPRELLYITLERTDVKLKFSNTGQDMELKVHKIQMDNQMLDAFHEVGFHSRNLKEDETLLHVSMHRQKLRQGNAIHIPYFSLLLREIAVQIDEILLDELWKFISNLQTQTGGDQLSNEDFLEDFLATKSHYKLPELSSSARMLYFDFFQLHPVHASFSYRSVPDFTSVTHNRNPMTYFRKGINNSIGNVEDVPLRLNTLTLEHVFKDANGMLSSIRRHYKQMLYREVYKVFLSADILGNPVGFVNNIGQGVHDFFYEPVNANVLSPDVAFGIARGTGSLIRNFSSASFNTMSKMTGSISRGVSTLAFDSEYLRDRQIMSNRPSGRYHIGDGLYEGSESLVRGVYDGVTGLVTQPMQGRDFKGVSLGLGKGIVGLMIKPTVGVLDLTSKTSEGMKNTANRITTTKEEFHERRRPPRYFGKDKMLQLYNRNTAWGQNLLGNINSGAFRDTDEYLDHIQQDNGRCFLLTNKRCMMIQVGRKDSKIDWDLSYDDIFKVEIVGDIVYLHIPETVAEKSLLFQFSARISSPKGIRITNSDRKKEIFDKLVEIMAEARDMNYNDFVSVGSAGNE